MTSKITRRDTFGLGAGMALAMVGAGAGATRAIAKGDHPPVRPRKADFTVMAGGLGFCEGPLLMADQSLLVADLSGGKFNRVYRDGRVKSVFGEIGAPSAGMVFGPDSCLYLAPTGPGVPSSLIKLNVLTGERTTLLDQYEGKQLNTFDDLVFDKWGGIYFTVFENPPVPPTAMSAGIYYFRDGKLTKLVSSDSWTNGIDIDPTGNWLYWTEYYTGRLFRRRIIGPGELQAPATHHADCIFIHPLPITYLDSLTVDAEGIVSVAVHDGVSLDRSGIMNFDPTGQPLDFIRFPDVSTTHVVMSWSGEKAAYVTLGATQTLAKMSWPRYGKKPLYGPPAEFLSA